MLPPQTHPPSEPIRRRHTPPRAGYATYRSCLRWEFGFTCAFCLLHEADFVEEGARGTALMRIEHHVVGSEDPSLVDVYGNCFWACGYCSRARKIVPVALRGQHLLEPCATAWGDHFVVVGDELHPREGDIDAAHTHRTYRIDLPRKVAYRKSRRERLDDARRAVCECPDEIARLLALAERLTGPDRSTVIRVVERLRRTVAEAEQVFDRYRAIPLDCDAACRCDATHDVPAFLATPTSGAKSAVPKITPDEVRRTAALARIALTDEEVARFTREIDAILVYMERIAAIDVSGVAPMTHAVAMAAPLRDDAVGPMLAADEALADAPERDDGFFRVPRIIAHDKES